MALLMLYSAVFALKSCCVKTCVILFVMYGSNGFSCVVAITKTSELGLYDVSILMS